MFLQYMLNISVRQQVHSRHRHAQRDHQRRRTRPADCAHITHNVWTDVDFQRANRNRSLDGIGVAVSVVAEKQTPSHKFVKCVARNNVGIEHSDRDWSLHAAHQARVARGGLARLDSERDWRSHATQTALAQSKSTRWLNANRVATNFNYHSNVRNARRMRLSSHHSQIVG